MSTTTAPSFRKMTADELRRDGSAAADAELERRAAKRKRNRITKPKTSDVAQQVTDAVLAELDRGTVPWSRPWSDAGGQRNAQSGRPYRGINQLLLSMAADSRGYTDPRWMTFGAAKKAGGQVRKGERGALVILWKRNRWTETADDGTETDRQAMLMRGYTVFNAAQVDGVELPELATPEPVDPIAAGESVISGYQDGPEVRHGGVSAYYQPATDVVALPERDYFDDAPAYYRVAFHELTHSTGHASRLNRDEVAGSITFGSENYSREELTAELGAAILCGTAGIPVDLPQTASYIDGWRRKLSADPKLIVQAAGRAQRAADHILGISFTDQSAGA